jgi:hypothetical protein
MQTTLRINDAIYREAKSEAAREGMTLTRFLEDALTFRVRMGRQAKKAVCQALPVFDSGKRVSASFDLAAAIRKTEAEGDESVASRLTGHSSRDKGARH